MEKYTHNGVEVLVQAVRFDEFAKSLKDHGIIPVELPVDIYNYVVLRYDLDGQTKYAVSGEYKTFLTTQIPEDSWEDLIRDCQNQANGEKPEKLRSRFNLLLGKAEAAAYKDISDKDPDGLPIMSIIGLSRLPKDEQDKFLQTVKRMMISYGYDKDYIDCVSMTPNEKSVITKLLNDEYYWLLDDEA